MTQPKVNMIEEYSRRIREFRKRGKLYEAEIWVNKCLHKYPDEFSFYFEKVCNLSVLHEDKAALQMLDDILLTNQNHYYMPSLKKAIYCAKDLKDNKKVIQYYNKYKAAGGKISSSMLFEAGKAHFYLDEFEKTIEYMQKSLATTDKIVNPYTHFKYICRAYFKLERWEEFLRSGQDFTNLIVNDKKDKDLINSINTDRSHIENMVLAANEVGNLEIAKYHEEILNKLVVTELSNEDLLKELDSTDTGDLFDDDDDDDEELTTTPMPYRPVPERKTTRTKTNGSATWNQKKYVIDLIIQLNLPDREMDEQHLDIGIIDEANIGTPVLIWAESLSNDEADLVIKTLEGQKAIRAIRTKFNRMTNQK